MEATIDTMREFLELELADVHLDRIELIWRRDALRAPSEWRSLLLSGDPDDERAAGREPPTVKADHIGRPVAEQGNPCSAGFRFW